MVSLEKLLGVTRTSHLVLSLFFFMEPTTMNFRLKYLAHDSDTILEIRKLYPDELLTRTPSMDWSIRGRTGLLIFILKFNFFMELPCHILCLGNSYSSPGFFMNFNESINFS